MKTDLICPICHEHNVHINHLLERNEHGTHSGYYAHCVDRDHPDITGVYPNPKDAMDGAIESGAYLEE